MLKKLLHFLLLALCCGTALAQQPSAQPALSLLFSSPRSPGRTA